MRCSRDIHAYKQIYGPFKVTSNANTHALDCEEEQHIAAFLFKGSMICVDYAAFSSRSWVDILYMHIINM